MKPVCSLNYKSMRSNDVSYFQVFFDKRINLKSKKDFKIIIEENGIKYQQTNKIKIVGNSVCFIYKNRNRLKNGKFKLTIEFSDTNDRSVYVRHSIPVYVDRVKWRTNFIERNEIG